MLRLHRSWRDVPRLFHGALLPGWLRPYTSLAAIEADAVDGGVVHDDRLVVDVRDVDVADVVNGPVVIEVTVAPVTAFVALARVPEAVVDAAIEADRRAPVAAMPYVAAVAPAPPARRPQQAGFRRLDPGARD